MKYFNYTVLTFLFFTMHLLTSCSSEEDGDIIGTYILTEISSSGCDNSSDNDSIDLSGDGCQDIGGEEICIQGTMTLTESIFSYSFDISSRGDTETISDSGNYTIEGSNISICNADGCDSSTFKISGDELTIRLPEDDFDGCALTLKGKK